MKPFYITFIFFLFIKCNTLPINESVYRSNSSGSNSSDSGDESKEFAVLLKKDQINKNEIKAEALTYLLNESDPQDKNTAAIIENKSRCDIIVSLVGISTNRIYHLPIPKNSKNQFIIEKGNYTVQSKLCGAKYYSQKNIADPLILKLSNN